MGPRRDRRPTTDGCRYSWCACGDTVALCPLFRGKTIHCQPRRPSPVPREAAAAVTVDRETRTVTMGHDVPRSRRRGGKRARLFLQLDTGRRTRFSSFVFVWRPNLAWISSTRGYFEARLPRHRRGAVVTHD